MCANEIIVVGYGVSGHLNYETYDPIKRIQI